MTPDELKALRRRIFKRGSKTYFTSSLFFPPAVQEDVFTLYAFVRTADDFVDRVPQDGDGFRAFRARWTHAARGGTSGDPVVDGHARLGERRGFDPAWTEAFLDAMEADLTIRAYPTVEALLGYVYGSAEVIGLYMARLMRLPPEADDAARLLGRAMQHINFIRDLDEDRRLGRTYLPLDGSGLRSLEPAEAEAEPDLFRAFVRREIDRYRGWQDEAVKGFRHIPWRMRVPIRTASRMYAWTASVIRHDPFVVYRRQVKPSASRIVLEVFKSSLAGTGA